MPVSAADHLEVRWRVKDSGEAWSSPVRTPVAHNIALDDLERGQNYEYQYRAVSNCGAKSDWTLSEHTVPGDPDGTIKLPDVKDTADGADGKAITAQSLASQVAVINPGFDAGDTGWTKGSGWSIKSDGSFGHGQGYAEKSGGASDAALRNNAVCFVQPGKSYKVQALIKAIGANGQCYARISWRDLNDSEISTTNGNLISGTTVAGSYAVGQAPTGAVFAHAEIAATSHTAGTYQVDNVISTLQPATADEIAENAGSLWTLKYKPQEVGPNLAYNTTFLDGPGKWINEIGTQEGLGTTSGGAVACGVTAGNSGSGNANFYEDNLFPASAGDVFFVSVSLSASASTSTVNFGIQWLDASGGVVSVATVASKSAGASAGSPMSKSLTAPSGVAKGQLILYINSPTVGDTGYANNIRVYREVLMQPGSGARLGDLRNQVMVGVGNYASGWSGGNITYSASNTNATITMGAATLRLGARSVSYNQASVSVSTGASGTGKEITYYLYLDDDDYSGGSKTLNATTSEVTTVSADGRVFVGSVLVFYPASGTGSGGGTAPCPDENAWVLRADPNGIRPDWPVRAHEIRGGHFLRLTDGTAGLVTYSERKPTDRVRVVSDGKALTCSTSAPLELAGADGCVLAPDAAGQFIKALFDGIHTDVLVEGVEDAGPGYVQHITCQNACFWTGDDPNYLFGHHNMKSIRSGP